MADPMHLAARFLHVTFAMLWIGTLGTIASVIVPSARGTREHAPNLGPILQRLRHTLWFGPLTFLAGAWLVTASGHSWGALTSAGWGHSVLGGIVLGLGMMGLEHGLVMPGLKAAHTAPAGERAGPLKKAGNGALVATLLGILAALLMVAGLLGGF